jgi:hypothetical protein
VPVEGDVAALDADHRGDERGPVEVLPPVLEEHRRLVLGEHADALPDRHAVLGVLSTDLDAARGGVRPLEELAASLERRVVRGRGAIGRRRLGHGQGIFERRGDDVGGGHGLLGKRPG